MAEQWAMNKQRQRHMGGGGGAKDVEGSTGQHHAPHIHIHSHAHGHTVHIMHPDGRHEAHEHPLGDAEGIAQHIHDHIGAAGGQPVSEGGPSPVEEEEFS